MWLDMISTLQLFPLPTHILWRRSPLIQPHHDHFRDHMPRIWQILCGVQEL